MYDTSLLPNHNKAAVNPCLCERVNPDQTRSNDTWKELQPDQTGGAGARDSGRSAHVITPRAAVSATAAAAGTITQLQRRRCQASPRQQQQRRRRRTDEATEFP